MFDSVFLKGYQWPFDARKMAGSSRVDMAVSALCARGGHAYMDFTAEPDGGVLNTLGEEGLAYLKNCSALKANPFERLAAINQKAVDFYASHDIDLSREPLEIAVCVIKPPSASSVRLALSGRRSISLPITEGFFPGQKLSS